MNIEMEDESLNFISDNDNNPTYLQDFNVRSCIERNNSIDDESKNK